MHVLIFTALYTRHPSKTGRPALQASRTFVQQQARALSAGHRVTVVAPEIVRSRDILERRPLVESEEAWTVYRPRCPHIPGIWWFFYLLISLWSTRSIDWGSVDIVHAHTAIPAGFAAAWLCRIRRKPFVLTIHRGEAFASFIEPRATRATVGWTIKQAQRIIAVSHSLQRQIEAVGMTGQFTVIPNIIDPERFYPSPIPPAAHDGPLRLLWLGGFAQDYYYRKGGDELLQAIALAQPKLPGGLRLTLAGDGPLRPESEARADSLGIAEICEYTGNLPHDQVRDWIHRSDALILASHSESFGVVLVEAMACGKPVIATRCGGPEEIVTPETGVLTQVKDPSSLAQGIVELWEGLDGFDPERIAAYAHTNFNPQRIASMLTQVYVEVTGSTPNSGIEAVDG